MSIVVDVLTGGSNNHETTSEAANGLATDFVSEGVVGAITNTSGVSPATGGFAVNEASSPDMTVDVSAGVAYVTATPTSQGSQVLRVKNSATESVSISANSSGSTKYDWIYISISASNAANPNAAGDNVATLVTSRSTSASSDDGTPPTYGYPIAVVTVANGASSIVDANITDKRVTTGATPADEAVTTAKIADASITNAKLSTTAGELGGAWQSWTPTFSNFTLGNGTINYARYTQVGKTVHFQMKVTLGSTSSVGTGPVISLPVTANSAQSSTGPAQRLGVVTFTDTGAANLHGSVQFNNDQNTIQMLALNATVTYLQQTAVTATVPFTWTTGDAFSISGTYEAA